MRIQYQTCCSLVCEQNPESALFIWCNSEGRHSLQKLRSDISEVCERTDRLLWDAYARSADNQLGGNRMGCLVFPRKRDNSLRVSEQEARFAFVETLLSQKSLRYSVEAPTSKTYSFTGKKPISAQTDLQVHDLADVGVCNVEFKKGGISSSNNSEIHSIYKDLEKLLREPFWGLWFHLIEGTDNSTIKHLTEVIAQQISKVQLKRNDVGAPGLTLHICLLRPGFSLQKMCRFILTMTSWSTIYDLAYVCRIQS